MAKPRSPQSQTRKDLVSNQILEGAAALFAERGFANTSLQDVANTLQISRTALYHYVSSKEQLLATLVEGITRETASALRSLDEDRSRAPVERLDAAVRGMVERVAENPARFRLLLMTEGGLPEKLAIEHREARRKTLEHLTNIIRDGVASGALRSLDPRLAAFSLLGVCNWVAWWYRPDADERPPREVAADLADMALAGLRGGDEPLDAASDVGRALEQLRRDVSTLERLIAEDPTGAPERDRSRATPADPDAETPAASSGRGAPRPRP